MKRILIVLTALVLGAGLGSHAHAAPVTPAEEQKRALDEVNRIRAQVGAPAVTAHPALNRAASGHARYAIETREYGHYENQKASAYFVGYDPGARAKRYGYTNSYIAEDYYMGSLGGSGTRTYLPVDNSIAWWMAAIYHRFPIIGPRAEQIGYGTAFKSGMGIQVLDFGTDYANRGKLVRWPLPYQRGVGTSLSGESPDPVAQFGGTFPTGYPVSMTWYDGASLSLSAATMTRVKDELSIAGYKLTPQNDKYHGYSTSASFIPKRPLEYGTSYRVTFTGAHAGTPFSTTWRFTTMPAPARMVRSSPVAGATGVGRTAGLSLSFNQPMRMYTLVRSPQSTLYSGGVGISLTRRIDDREVAINIAQPTTVTTKAVSVKPSLALEPNTAYRLTWTLADAWGRPQRGSVYFTTGG